MVRFLNCHFGILIYFLYLACELFLLWQGRSCGLFPEPPPGTDQLSMLQCAQGLADGVLPAAPYRYSYAYTGYLAVLSMLTGGSPVGMRIGQALLCALIPVMIERTGRLMLIGRNAARIAALLYVFYAPALLISLDFLRAAPLGLVFLCFLYALLRGCRRNAPGWFAAAGIAAAGCVLGRENFGPVIFLPLLFLLFPAVRRRISVKKAAGCYLAAAVIPVLAVMVFNAIRYDSFQPVPGNAGNVMKFYYGESTLRDLGQAAAAVARTVPVQLGNFLSSYELPNSLSVYAHREVLPFLKIFGIPFNFLIAAACVGCFGFRRNRGVLLAALLVCGYAASLLFFTMFYRFRIPAVPLLALLAGAGIWTGYRWIRRRNFRALAAGCGFLLLFLGLTAVDPDSRRSFAERAAVSRLLIDSWRFAEAEAYLKKMKNDGFEVRPGAKLLIRGLLENGEEKRAAENAIWFFPELQQRKPSGP